MSDTECNVTVTRVLLICACLGDCLLQRRKERLLSHWLPSVSSRCSVAQPTSPVWIQDHPPSILLSAFIWTINPSLSLVICVSRRDTTRVTVRPGLWISLYSNKIVAQMWQFHLSVVDRVAGPASTAPMCNPYGLACLSIRPYPLLILEARYFNAPLQISDSRLAARIHATKYKG
jgi:hypothetical protein